MDASPIIIAGGGIAGLASALALGSHDALILEQASAITTAGAGIQLGPNAVRALQRLGAWDAVQPYTSKPTDIQFRDGLTGKLMKQLALGAEFSPRYGADYHVAHRSGLHAGLMEVLRSRPNIQLELGQILQHVEVGHQDVQVRVKGRSRRAPALIATDGVQSSLRQLLFPGTKAMPSEAAFHRALLPSPVNTDISLDSVTVWMLPHAHVVHYMVSNPQRLNVVVVTQEDKIPADLCEQATPDLADLLSEAHPHFSIWPALYVSPLTKWTSGNVLLLGDAVHGTLPYMAQGAAMALEDAACLRQVLESTHSLRHAFTETASRRMARTRRLHLETLQTGRVYHAAGLFRQLRNFGMPMLPNAMMLHKLDWLYKN